MIHDFFSISSLPPLTTHLAELLNQHPDQALQVGEIVNEVAKQVLPTHLIFQNPQNLTHPRFNFTNAASQTSRNSKFETDCGEQSGIKREREEEKEDSSTVVPHKRSKFGNSTDSISAELNKFNNSLPLKMKSEEWQNSLKLGEVVASQNSTFEGDCGIQEEAYTIVHVNGVYKGDKLQNSVIHGKGKIIYTNGDVYEGELRNGVIHGKGKMDFADGDVYEGELQNGAIHGRGKMDFSEGQMYQMYEGEWQNSAMHGIGKMLFSEGQVYQMYEGEWQNGAMHGIGKMVYSNGFIYEGEWQNDKTAGNGRMTSLDFT